MFKVPLTTVLEVNAHPDAHSLDLITVYGFQVVAKKNQYKVGDQVIYIPIDSVISEWLEVKLFPEGSKIKLNNRRVKQIRIRKFPSQGMLIDTKDVAEKIKKFKLEEDYAEILGVTKYEPPFADHAPRVTIKRNKPLENSRFRQYKGLEALKWFPNLFKEGDPVVVQCKLHGTNCRASIQPSSVNTWKKKLKKLFGLLPKWEHCYGSNLVQLQDRPGWTGFYGEDVYGKALQKVDAFNKMKPGETIFGEIIGKGIQKGFDYGHEEPHFVLFDVMTTKDDGTQEYMNPDDAQIYAQERGFTFVPVLFKGGYNREDMERLCRGHSVYCPKQKIREGIVIKAKTEYGANGGKKALKLLNPDYLDLDNTDIH